MKRTVTWIALALVAVAVYFAPAPGAPVETVRGTGAAERAYLEGGR